MPVVISRPITFASLVRVAGIALGLALGLWLALPFADVTAKCPPAGEGLVQCRLQKSWLPAVVKLVATVVVCRWALFAALISLPAALRRKLAGGTLRDPAKIKRDLVRETRPDWEADPVLRAATWGVTYEGLGEGRTAAEPVDVEPLLADVRPEPADAPQPQPHADAAPEIPEPPAKPARRRTDPQPEAEPPARKIRRRSEADKPSRRKHDPLARPALDADAAVRRAASDADAVAAAFGAAPEPASDRDRPAVDPPADADRPVSAPAPDRPDRRDKLRRVDDRRGAAALGGDLASESEVLAEFDRLLEEQRAKRSRPGDAPSGPSGSVSLAALARALGDVADPGEAARFAQLIAAARDADERDHAAG